MSPNRARPVSPARTRPASSSRGSRPGRQEAPRRLDLYHMLSAVVGAYVGLVFYSLITPGQIPHEPPVPSPDPRSHLVIAHLVAKPESDGLFHVRGDVKNSNDKPCRFANVTVRFYDAQGRELTHTLAIVEAIPAGGERPFEARAMAQGAVRFEAAADLAQY